MQEALAVDTKRAGELIGLSGRTVQRLIRSGRIRAVRTNRRVIVPLTALEEFLQAPAHPTPSRLTTENNDAGES